LPWIFIPRHVSHIFSLQTVTTFEPIIWSHWNSNLICILWYQTTVQNLKSVLKLYLETIGGGQRDGRTHTHQTKRRVSHNTSLLQGQKLTVAHGDWNFSWATKIIPQRSPAGDYNFTFPCRKFDVWSELFTIRPREI
jgi:hypothetical protein